MGDDNKGCSIHDLPDDILAQIFRICVTLCDFDPPGYQLQATSYKARIALCSIDHRMRILAIATPDLWTDVQLGLPYSYPPIPLLELWVNRMGAVPPIQLDFYKETGFNWKSHAESIDAQHVIRTTNLLLPHIHRWRSLKTFFINETAQAFANLSLENATSLEDIDAISSCDQDVNEKVLARIARLPVLRSLTWFDYYIPREFQPPCPISNSPWNHLQYLKLSTNLPPHMLLQLLSTLTSAEVISFDLWTGVQPPSSHVSKSTPPPLICLPNLRELSINADSNIYSIFQRLDLPAIEALRVLSIANEQDEGTTSVIGYRDFIIRASASLETGVFALSGFSEDDILELFSYPEIFRIQTATFHIWGDQPSKCGTAAKAVEFLEDKRPDLQPFLRDWMHAPVTDIGWDRRFY